MLKKIESSDGSEIFSDIHSACSECITSNSDGNTVSVTCPIDGKARRVGYRKTKAGNVRACSWGCKTVRNFKAEFESLVIGLKYFAEIKKGILNETKKDERMHVERLVHNLKTLNAQCMNELNRIVPQDRFVKNISTSNSVAVVEDIIGNNMRAAALTSLKLAKHLMAVKSEFFVYEIDLQESPLLRIERHKLRDVLMLVLYKFFGELYDRGVTVDVDNYFGYGFFDFDTVNVAFYYIVENISKYVCPNTSVKVNLNQKGNMHYVEFEMTSMHIDSDEEGKIFHKGYSGRQAKTSGKAGSGFGMYQAKKLLEYNHATIDFKVGDICFDQDGITYSDNIVTVVLPVANPE